MLPSAEGVWSVKFLQVSPSPWVQCAQKTPERQRRWGGSLQCAVRGGREDISQSLPSSGPEGHRSALSQSRHLACLQPPGLRGPPTTANPSSSSPLAACLPCRHSDPPGPESLHWPIPPACLPTPCTPKGLFAQQVLTSCTLVKSLNFSALLRVDPHLLQGGLSLLGVSPLPPRAASGLFLYLTVTPYHNPHLLWASLTHWVCGFYLLHDWGCHPEDKRGLKWPVQSGEETLVRRMTVTGMSVSSPCRGRNRKDGNSQGTRSWMDHLRGSVTVTTSCHQTCLCVLMACSWSLCGSLSPQLFPTLSVRSSFTLFYRWAGWEITNSARPSCWVRNEADVIWVGHGDTQVTFLAQDMDLWVQP